MTLFESIILGIIQGIAEFLPISSSGHLAIFKKLFGLKDVGLTYDILLHAGTLVAVFIVYWKDILRLIIEGIGIIVDACRNIGRFFKKLSGNKQINYVKVLRTTPDNPAQKAGILAGDIIYKVDGKDVSEKSSEDVAKLIRGPEGSEVKITVVRNKEEKEFNLKREKINNVSAFVDYKDKTAILTIRRFDTDTGNLVKKIAQEIKTKKCDKIVLDLRDNGGGYVDSAKQVASFWIDDDVVVLQKSQNGVYNETTYTSSGQATLKGIKTNVLINGNTASAAEILAGALRDYDLAILIGEKTYGKGSVQELAPVDNVGGNDYLRVTIAKWYTPKGKNINKDGIKPDKEVKRSFEQINKDEDPQLEAALKD